MRVHVSTILDCTPEKAWQEVQTSKLLDYVAAPLVRFVPQQPAAFPAIWQDGKYQVQMRVLGWIPFGKHWIVISHPAADSTPGQQHYELLDDGYGDLISTWRHLITIQETVDGRTHYTDTIDVAASLLTPGVWVFASIFYRHRQRRWQKLVQSGFDYGHSGK